MPPSPEEIQLQNRKRYGQSATEPLAKKQSNQTTVSGISGAFIPSAAGPSGKPQDASFQLNQTKVSGMSGAFISSATGPSRKTQDASQQQ